MNRWHIPRLGSVTILLSLLLVGAGFALKEAHVQAQPVQFMTAESLPGYPAGYPTSGETLVFSDTFASGSAINWALPSGWNEAQEASNWFVHAATADSAGLIQPRIFSAYRFQADVRLGSGSASLWYRRSFDGSGYRLDISSGGLSLVRIIREDPEIFLAGDATPISSAAWHTIQINGALGHLEVWVDSALRLDYTDASPWYAGGIALEASGGAVSVDFDNLEIWVPQSAVPAWVQSIGYSGGFVASVEIDPANPNVVYAGGGARVYKSTNSGASWTGLDQLVPFANYISDLLISPSAPQTVYALAGYQALFKSTDAGVIWKRIFSQQQIISAAVSQADASLLLAGTSDGKVYLTTTGGSSWTDISSTLPITQSVSFVKIISSSEFWAGTGSLQGGGLYHTTDSGASWDPVYVGEASHRSVTGIYIDPYDSENLYVGFADPYQGAPNPGEHQLFISEDGGETWTDFDAAPQIGGWILAKAADSTLYRSLAGNLLQSKNAGQDWIKVNPAPPMLAIDPTDLAIDPTNSQILYLPGKFSSFFKSTTEGSSWVEIKQGIIAGGAMLLAVPNVSGSPLVYTDGSKSTDYGTNWETYTYNGIGHPFYDEVAINPLDPQNLWVAVDKGSVYESTDGAASFTTLVNLDSDGRGFRFGPVYALATAPSEPDRIYAQRNGMGIFKTENAGGGWTFLFHSEVDYTYSLAVDPLDADILYSGYTPKPFQDWAMVRKTIDGGDTWTTTLTVSHSTGVTAVAIDPNFPSTIYAGSAGRSDTGGGTIYRSSNNGDIWSKLNEHFTMLTVWGQPQLVIVPQDPSTVYAATWLGGTWNTTDAGVTWERLDQAPQSATALSIKPAHPNVIYAADRTRPVVWMTADGGATWADIADFSSDGAFLVNRVLAVANDTVYVSTFGPGIHGGKLYRSTNGGADWVNISGSLPRSVLDIAVNPNNPQVVYVTIHIHGAYLTTDGGATWTEMSRFPNIGGYDIEVDPVSPSTLYAAGIGATTVPDWVMPGGYSLSDKSGVYQSTDSGVTWTQILTTTNECRAIRIYPGDHNLLFAAALDDGLQVSTDGGATWTGYNTGLDSLNLTSLAVSGDKIYAGTQGFGVYSGDLNPTTGAVTWQAARSNKPVPSVYSLRITVDSADSNRIYVSANPGGLFRSDDGGATWYDKNFLTPSVIVDDPVRQGYYTFALNPNDTDEVWLGTYGKGIYKSYDGMDFDIGANGTDQLMLGKHINNILIDSAFGVIAASEEGVYQTQDGGQTWTDFNEGLDTPQVRTLAITGNGMLLAGTAGYELYSRTPTSSSWEQMNAFGDWGKIWPIWNDRPNYQFTSILFHPSDPNIVYFGTFPAGIFMSTDSGSHWLESNVGWTIDGVFSTVFQPENPDSIYVGTYNGVNHSADGGSHWEKWDTGWPPEQWVYAIDFDPRNPDILYACSKNGENEGTGRVGFHGTVMKSTDGGHTWIPITTGLNTNQEFYKIIVDKNNPDTLYLASQREGVFISRDGGSLWLPFNLGLSNTSAGTNGNNVTNPLALSADGHFLYFGTNHSGVFRRLLFNFNYFLPLVSKGAP
jgi:photosystem II stability/assembly factor-like uncharacterized protein